MTVTVRPAILVSLKFAPGLLKEVRSIGRGLEAQGVPVRYVLSSRYRAIGGLEGVVYEPVVSGSMWELLRDTASPLVRRDLRNLFAEPAAVVLFYNTHPLNVRIIRLLRGRHPGTMVITYIHDPYKPGVAVYGSLRGAVIRAAEAVQVRTARLSDAIVVPSPYAAELFRRRYPCTLELHVAPLLVPDDGYALIPKADRTFFTIAGTAHKATGHELFADLVTTSAARGLPHRFALVTASRVDKILARIPAFAQDRLRVFCKTPLTDEEIDCVLARSLAVFRLDHEVTQSGVIPVAYKHGTPVIARDIPGLRQQVRHNVDGYLVPERCSPDDLLEAMCVVKDRFESLSAGARASYETTWDARLFSRHYGWLLRRVAPHRGRGAIPPAEAQELE